jgi:hypothetical protein
MAYLEFDAHEGAGPRLVTAIASLREPRTTMFGVNLVTGFRPDLWRAVAPHDAPPELQGFDADLVGAEGYRMPATQHDAVLWLSEARTTSSSTPLARQSPRFTTSLRSRRRPRAGRTSTTAISPGSSTGAKTRP